LRVVMAQTMAMERCNKRRRRRKWRNSYYSTAEPLVINCMFQCCTCVNNLQNSNIHYDMMN
jgi:hypothetical protein